MFYFPRLQGQRPASALAGGVLNLPALGDQSEESAAIAERRFDSEMRQVMQCKESGVPVGLFLPGRRSIVPHAPQDSGTIGAFGDLYMHLLSVSDSLEFHVPVGGTHTDQRPTGTNAEVQAARPGTAIYVYRKWEIRIEYTVHGLSLNVR
jgi:hypothetical protein